MRLEKSILRDQRVVQRPSGTRALNKRFDETDTGHRTSQGNQPPETGPEPGAQPLSHFWMKLTETGLAVDISECTRSLGVTIPVAISTPAHKVLFDIDPESESFCQPPEKRLLTVIDLYRRTYAETPMEVLNLFSVHPWKRGRYAGLIFTVYTVPHPEGGEALVIAFPIQPHQHETRVFNPVGDGHAEAPDL